MLIMAQQLGFEAAALNPEQRLREAVEDTVDILATAGASISIVEPDEPSTAAEAPLEPELLAEALMDWASEVYDFMADGDAGPGRETFSLPTADDAGHPLAVVIAASEPVAQMLRHRLG